MKKLLLLMLILATQLNVNAVVGVQHWTKQLQEQPDLQQLMPGMQQMDAEEFLSMTPKKYKQQNGKRLGLKKSIQLKAAQKMIKRSMKKSGKKGIEIPKGIYILLAILGWAWLAMGLMDDFSTMNWLWCLLLYFLFFLPGLIYALIKMKEYY